MSGVCDRCVCACVRAPLCANVCVCACMYDSCVLVCVAGVTGACIVVISQTHWLVSQERLSLRAGTSVFIEYSGAI